MMSQITKKKKYIEIIKELKNFGIKQVIFMDIAGYFLPYHFDEIFSLLNQKIKFGIHAHNNFSVGV